MATIKEIQIKYKNKISPFDLEILISHALGKPREFVLTHPEYNLTKYQVLRIKYYVSKRKKNIPIAYITGHKEFFGLDFKVNENTLVPRPETEILVGEALDLLRNKSFSKKIIVADIGTGSGNIIISMIKSILGYELQVTSYKFYGIDISKKALKVAKENAKKHKVDKKIKFLQGNLIEPLIKNLPRVTSNLSLIILANLPYLDKEWKNLLDSSESAGLKFEPKIALEAGVDGLDLYRELSKQAKKLKEKNIPTVIFCEIGDIQKDEMKKIFSWASKAEFKKDLSGKYRVCQVEI